jgi:NADH dehydrogenase
MAECPIIIYHERGLNKEIRHHEALMDNKFRRPHHIVILGGGFGGLEAARRLRRAPVRITLIDQRNFHLFQPLLYQVATGGLSPANIAAPLRSVLRHQSNVRVLLGEATGIDAAGRKVLLKDDRVDYETLIVATGSVPYYFGHDKWQRSAPGLKTVEDALDIRRRLLSAFEYAENEKDMERRRSWLTFVIVGAGPTGVELAGAVAELAYHTLAHDFRSICTRETRIFLIEVADRILPSYPLVLSGKAQAKLERLGVSVRLKTKVSDVRADGVTVHLPAREVMEIIPARTVLWTAGIRASPFGRVLAAGTGAETDGGGRIRVLSDLSLPGHPEIFVIGDLSCCAGPEEQPLPGIAPVAVQQARYVATVIKRRLGGITGPRPFAFVDHGQMTTIGRSAAVAQIGKLQFNGFLAWLTWLIVHLMAMVQFENRLLVLIQWAWNYFTRNRSARLISGNGSPGRQG